MDSIIEKAIDRRKSGKYEESRELLTTLLSIEAYEAKAHLHIAWSYDNEGKEQEAIFHYESALSGFLSKVERFDALLGLASTLRSMGSYDDALHFFEIILTDYPDSVEALPFYAMCLYNSGRHKESTALLLELLVSTTSSELIKKYQRSILLYAKDLHRMW